MWELLIIPIIAVGVWIVSTLLRNAEETKNAGKKPEKVTDLDRFLREVRRRQEGREPEPALRRRVDREEEPQRAERRREVPPRTRRRAPVQAEAIPVVLPVDEVEVVTAVPVLSVLEAPPLPGGMAANAALTSRLPSAALVGLRDLLASRDGLCKAMILHEVLGPPLSHRRR